MYGVTARGSTLLKVVSELLCLSLWFLSTGIYNCSERVCHGYKYRSVYLIPYLRTSGKPSDPELDHDALVVLILWPTAASLLKLVSP